jgi:hypothetical protein
MKKYFLIAIAGFLFSCGGEESSTEEGGSEESSEETPSIDMDGPDVEVVVLDFSIEDRETNVEVINRLEEDIKSVSGDICYLDSAGNNLENIFGNPRSTHFQQMENPFLVKSMSSKKLTLGNKLDSDAQGLEVRNVKVKTVSGEKIEIEE